MRTQFHKLLEVLTGVLLVLPIGILAPMMTPGWGFGGHSVLPGFAYLVTAVMGLLAGFCYSHIYGPRYYLVYMSGMFVAALGGLTLNSLILSKTDVVFKFVLVISTLVGVAPGFFLSRFLKKIQDAIFPPSQAELARHRLIDEDRKREAQYRRPSVDDIKGKLKYRSTVMVLFLLSIIPPLGFLASLLVYKGSPSGYGRRVAFNGMCLSVVILAVYGLIYYYVISMGSGNEAEKVGDKIASFNEIKPDSARPSGAGPKAGRVDSNDLNSLVDMVQHGGEGQKSIALTNLVHRVDPKAASPQDVKTVAKLMKQLAFDKHEEWSTRSTAVEGMVKWGGRFSAPLLVQLLDDKEDFVRQTSYQQLAIVKDPSALETVVKRYAADESNNQAGDCLESCGADAEPAVLKYLPDADQPGIKRLLEYLDRHGTAKSIEPLRSLRAHWMLFDFSLTGEIDRTIADIQRHKGR
jgi:hypothetical protein